MSSNFLVENKGLFHGSWSAFSDAVCYRRAGIEDLSGLIISYNNTRTLMNNQYYLFVVYWLLIANRTMRWQVRTKGFWRNNILAKNPKTYWVSRRSKQTWGFLRHYVQVSLDWGTCTIVLDAFLWNIFSSGGMCFGVCISWIIHSFMHDLFSHTFLRNAR